MKKDKKFLNELENNLEGISFKNKKKIVEKYDLLIKNEKESGKKITVILKEIGKPKEIAEKEKALLGKEPLTVRIKEKAKKISSNTKESIEKVKKNLKKKKKEKENVKKKKLTVDKKAIKEEKKKLKEEKNALKKKLREEKKELKKKIKEERKEKEEKKEKKSLLAFLTKDITLKKKNKDKEGILVPYEEEKATPSEIISDIKEEIQEEISEVSEIVSEKRLFESKKDRRKRIILKTLGVIITVLLMIIWFWAATIFIASLFAYLDGIKFIGFCIALGGLTFLLLWVIVMVNRAVFKKKNNLVLNLIVCFVTLGIIALGVALGMKQVSEIKTVKDVSVKYSMTTKLSTYTLPSEPNEKFTITFNSNYNTQYNIKHDNTLKNKIRIEVKYYECYYDYYIKQTSNSTYISLKLDDRDRLSVYIDDLKEGLVFDNDELSRYSVRITVNPKDEGRLIIQN